MIKLSRCFQTLILPSLKLIGNNYILGSCKKFYIQNLTDNQNNQNNHNSNDKQVKDTNDVKDESNQINDMIKIMIKIILMKIHKTIIYIFSMAATDYYLIQYY